MGAPLDPGTMPPIHHLDRAVCALIETLEFNGFLDLEVKVAVAGLASMVFIPIPEGAARRLVGDGAGRVLATREECVAQWRRIAAGLRARPPRRFVLRGEHETLVEALSGYFVRALRTQVEA